MLMTQRARGLAEIREAGGEGEAREDVRGPAVERRLDIGEQLRDLAA